MKTPLFRYCIPTYSYKTNHSLQTKFYGSRPNYPFNRLRLIFPQNKALNYFSRDQLRSLSPHQVASLRLTTLSNFPGKICSSDYLLNNLYKNFLRTDMFRVMFLNLVHQFSYSLHLLKILTSPASIRYLKISSTFQSSRAPTFNRSQSAYKLLLL